jgi:hypothetical protein
MAIREIVRNMRPVRAHRDSDRDSRPGALRWTTLDGTPCHLPTFRQQLDRLAVRLLSEPVDQELGTPVDLARLEQFIRRKHGADLRLYARAWRRTAQLDHQLSAMRAGGTRPTYYAPDTRRKARGDAKDGRGYAWAREELKTELGKARPRLRRADPLQSAVINSAWDFIVRSVYPDYDPNREIDRRVPALVNRLTSAYLTIQFPTLCKNITPDRIRRRPSVKRAKS